MYSRSTGYYDKIYHFKNYDQACDYLLTTVSVHHSDAKSFLDVACGTGMHAERLTRSFQVEGLDINPEFLSVARKRNPSVQFHQGNMIDFDLGRQFDIVACLFSSIAYVQTEENLKRTIATLGKHVAPHGILLIEPLFPPENYWVGRVTMNTYDSPELKIVWMYISERAGELARLNYHFMVGTPDGIETFEEVHDLGLFTDRNYRDAFAGAGFVAEYESPGPMNRGLYIARRAN